MPGPGGCCSPGPDAGARGFGDSGRPLGAARAGRGSPRVAPAGVVASWRGGTRAAGGLVQGALDSAGIERRSWRPGRGVGENRRTVEAVYGYYGRLFIEHPYLQWAGLAAMIGPAFYAGFRDLGMLPDAVRAAVIAALGQASRRLAGRAAGDLGFYETTFLTMQKKIFEDQAVMHEAYLAGGVAQIEEFYRARIIDTATLEAWRQIDAGRRAAAADPVADGNRTLLFREQHDIIDRYYARMLAYRWPLGRTFTYLLTLAGSPSVPHAQSFPQRYPLRIDARLPPIAISTRTPLADGNIGLFADRWKLIDADTLPAYQAFIRDHPGQARALVATPLSQRVTGYRLLARAGQLAAAALTRWDVDLRAASPGPPMPAARPARQPPRAAATVIDLASTPTRESASLGRRHCQPDLGEPRPRAVQHHDHATRRPRLSRGSGDGGHAQLHSCRGPGPADSPASACQPRRHHPAHRRLRRTVGLARQRGHQLAY